MVSGGGKPAWRWRLRRARAALAANERDRVERDTAVLIDDCLRAHARPLAGYMACGGELRLDPLLAAIWQRGERVWLPRVIADGALIWHPVAAASQLRPGTYRIREPDPRQVAAEDLPQNCLMVVPGLGFATDGARLGQGGGYYDRLLAAPPPGLLSVGVGFACQLVEGLPAAAHDRRVSSLIIDGQWLISPQRPDSSSV